MTTKIELVLKTSQNLCWHEEGTPQMLRIIRKKNVSDWKHRNLFSPYFNFWSVLHTQYLPLANLKADIICMFPWPISVKKIWRLLMACTTTTSLQQWQDNDKKSPKNWWPFRYSQIRLLVIYFVGKLLTSALHAFSTYDKWLYVKNILTWFLCTYNIHQHTTAFIAVHFQ